MAIRDEVKVRTKTVPDAIDDTSALEAYELAAQYRLAAFRAFGKSHRYNPTTNSAEVNYRRYELYSEAADQWDAVVRAWIVEKTKS